MSERNTYFYQNQTAIERSKINKISVIMTIMIVLNFYNIFITEDERAKCF